MGIDVKKFRWENSPCSPYEQRITLFIGKIPMGSVWKAGRLESYGMHSGLPYTPQTEYYSTPKEAMWALEKQVYEWFKEIENTA